MCAPTAKSRHDPHTPFFRRSLAPAGHRLWEGIAFRDYLRAHPEVAARYAALKWELAAQYREDREGYTEAKTAFVRDVTDKALQEGCDDIY